MKIRRAGTCPRRCWNLQLYTHLQPEIATTSVRTGFAMTKKDCLFMSLRGACAVAISCRNC